MSSRLLRALSLAVVWSLLLVPTPAFAGSKFRVCTGATLREGNWTLLEPPAFDHTGIQTLSGDPVKIYRYALDPVDRRTVFIANNEQVKRSTDGGCSWDEVFRIDASLATSAPGSYCAQNYRPGSMRFNCVVSSIEVVRPPAASAGRVYLQVSSVPMRPDWLHMRSPFGYGTGFYWMTYLPSQRAHGYAMSWIFVSEDGGDTWSLLNEMSGEVATRPGHGDLVVHPRDPMSLYVVRHATAEGELSGYLVKSEDGGQTWEPRGAMPAVNHLAVNPNEPGDLWALSPIRGLMHSTDDGGSWNEVPGPYGSPTDLAVFFGKTATTIALGGDQRKIDVSPDGGETWISHELDAALFGGDAIPGLPLGSGEPPPQLPVVGYGEHRLLDSVEIEFGSSDRMLFVAANGGRGWVGRMDIRSGSMPFVREPLTQDEADDEEPAPDDDLQARLDRGPGSLSLLSHCYSNYTCTHLGIYRGPGA